jgi:hypothetical protein
MDAMFDLRNWGVPRLLGSALNGENVLTGADFICSKLMTKLSKELGLELDEDEEQSDASTS